MKKILYVRGGPYEVQIDSYNLQEIGLAKAMYRNGYQMDLVYWTTKTDRDEQYNANGIVLNIFWRKGIRLLRTGIFPQICNRDFLGGYDAVIVTEYSQLMVVLLSRYVSNLYVYNGSYYNLFKIPCMEKIYDKLFVNRINATVKKVFCKTSFAEKYLESKGIIHTEITGVGLDTDKFNECLEPTEETVKLVEQMQNHRNILYVGSLIERKNVELVYQAFQAVKEYPNMEDVQLIVIGKGKEEYRRKCERHIKQDNAYIYVPAIKNAQLKFIYPKANIFVLPSVQEIFGMVLLEAMYFGTCVISSYTAGADTLITDSVNGYIIKEFEMEKWRDKFVEVLNDENSARRIGRAAKTTIETKFQWNSISKKMLFSMFGEDFDEREDT